MAALLDTCGNAAHGQLGGAQPKVHDFDAVALRFKARSRAAWPSPLSVVSKPKSALTAASRSISRAEQPNLDTELHASILLGPSVAASTDLRFGDDDAPRAVASNMLV
jgi:hypothetical protein